MTITKYTLLRFVGITAILGILAGCAAAPIQEMSDARQAVQAAREAGAPVHSPVIMNKAEQELSNAENKINNGDYKNARNDAVTARKEAVKARNIALAMAQAKEAISEAQALGALTQETRDWLAKAEAESIAGDEEEVARTTQQARQAAQDDVRRYKDEKQRAEQENQAWLHKVTPLLDQVRGASGRLSSDQQEILRNGEEAYQQNQGHQAYNLISAVLAAVLTLPPVSNSLQYHVELGDTLWTIAAKRSVYGNPLWWPLILLSNRDQIPDADNLNPGQTLNIELEPDKALVAMAVRHAQRREGTADKVKEMDRQFLHDAK